jgi:hypothetical protein
MGTISNEFNFTAKIITGIDKDGNQYSSREDVNLVFDSERIVLTTSNEKFAFSKKDITGLSLIASNSGWDRKKSLIMFGCGTAVLVLGVLLNWGFLAVLTLFILPPIGIIYLSVDGRSFLVQFSRRSSIVFSFHIKRDNNLKSEINKSFNQWKDL